MSCAMDRSDFQAWLVGAACQSQAPAEASAPGQCAPPAPRGLQVLAALWFSLSQALNRLRIRNLILTIHFNRDVLQTPAPIRVEHEAVR